jgi:SAM-dependent methyltransferase
MDASADTDTEAYVRLYDRFWSDFPALMAQKLLRFHEDHAPTSKRTALDVGCGTGIVAAAMAEAGYRVIGIDHSPAMLQRASKRLDGLPAEWIAADASDFRVPETSAFAFSTYDVPNYLPDMERVEAYLSCVFHAVDEGGLFVFDMLTVKGILESNTVLIKDEPDALLVVRGAATGKEALLRVSAAFRAPDGTVQLVRSTEHSWSHPVAAVLAALERQGWLDAMVVSPDDLRSPLAAPEESSRVVFTARRPG